MDKKPVKFKENDIVKISERLVSYKNNAIVTIVNPIHYYNSSGSPVCRVIFNNGIITTFDQEWLTKVTKLHKALM